MLNGTARLLNDVKYFSCVVEFINSTKQTVNDIIYFVRFQNNRSVMTKEAKQAAKLEKKLKILLGGYQVILLKGLLPDSLFLALLFAYS